MVDKSDGLRAAKDGNAADDTRSVVPRRNVCQAIAIYDAEVLHFQTVYLVDFIHNIVVGLLNGKAERATLFHDAIDVGSNDTLFRREKAITAAQR